MSNMLHGPGLVLTLLVLLSGCYYYVNGQFDSFVQVPSNLVGEFEQVPRVFSLDYEEVDVAAGTSRTVRGGAEHVYGVHRKIIFNRK